MLLFSHNSSLNSNVLPGASKTWLAMLIHTQALQSKGGCNVHAPCTSSSLKGPLGGKKITKQVWLQDQKCNFGLQAKQQ